MEIRLIRYKSTNCYFIDTGRGLLAFDAGWPGTFSVYRDLVKKEGYGMGDIKWLIVSHFHMDHAGLAGMLINHGVQFLIFKNQFFAIEGMEALIQRKGMDYTPIDLNRTISLDLSESRKWLQTIGVLGEIIQTNGHGEDHVSLILDSGEAFIGDLNPLEYVAIQDDPLTRSNWSELRKKGAKSIFPAHVEPFRMGKE
jgi:glyoxylase-like metal-dependent hydrolase (beta-lactamase superfamily II)